MDDGEKEAEEGNGGMKKYVESAPSVPAPPQRRMSAKKKQAILAALYAYQEANGLPAVKELARQAGVKASVVWEMAMRKDVSAFAWRKVGAALGVDGVAEKGGSNGTTDL